MNHLALTHDSEIAAKMRDVLSALYEVTDGGLITDESVPACVETLRRFFDLLPADTVIEMSDMPDGWCDVMTALSAKVGLPRTFQAVRLSTGLYL
jgi:hypothetical protein